MTIIPTIVALASGAGRAGVAVIRVSGSQVAALIPQITSLRETPQPRMAVLCDIQNPADKSLIDRALLLYFKAPHSFTGEDVLELHVHGGTAIIKDVLSLLCSFEHVELAGPGAFSRRAFENGKLDLTEAEAIADLVDAQTSQQRRQALRQMNGELGRLYQGWAERLTHILALSEAEIDFADEEDIPTEITAGREEERAALLQEIKNHLADNHRGEKIREGFTVALLGAPNAGKSSLLNALTRQETAIVSSTPGTTRDVIEAQLDLGGYAVTLADTAGLREAADEIESEGVRRALMRAQHADFKILLFDGTVLPDKETKALFDSNTLIVVNKSDKADHKLKNDPFFAEALTISAKQGNGVPALTSRLIKEIEKRFASTDLPALTRIRHRQNLEECVTHLSRAGDVAHVELRTEDLRLALRALGRITGRVDVEDLLDRIFSSFCIGK